MVSQETAASNRHILVDAMLHDVRERPWTGIPRISARAHGVCSHHHPCELGLLGPGLATLRCRLSATGCNYRKQAVVMHQYHSVLHVLHRQGVVRG